MNNIFTIRSVFTIVIASLFMGFSVVALVLSVSTALFPKTDPRLLTVLSIFIGQGVIVLPVFTIVYLKNKSFTQTFRLKPISNNSIFSIVILSLGTIILSDEIDRVIGMVLPRPDYIEKLAELFQFDSLLYALLLIVATVVIAPFSEEVLFRGFLQKYLEVHWKNVTKAVLVTSLFFAAVHMNPGWIIQIYLLGIILGYLSWRTKSIFPGLILHSLNNGLALIMENIQAPWFNYYTWKNHVSPLFLLLAVFLFYRGYKTINSSSEEAMVKQ
jgi:membrane protease YdiL (CAAX protease family)